MFHMTEMASEPRVSSASIRPRSQRSMAKEEKLIDAVRKFPCLWEAKHLAHKEQWTRENAWLEVVKVMNANIGASDTPFTIEEYQKKWKSLRDRFVRERKLVTNWMSGDPGPESRPETPLDDSISSVSEGDHSQISEKRCKRKSEIDYDEVLLNRLKQIDERRAQRDNARNKELDEEDHFASTVASSLRRLAPNQRSLCKLQIQQLLHNFEFPPDVLMPSGHMNSQPGNSFYNFP